MALFKEPGAFLSNESLYFILMLHRNMAEREGFEPPRPPEGLSVFKTDAINRSAISPIFFVSETVLSNTG